ncbi:MAG: hypothetical protein ABF326_05250 [Arenicellales bacterium]
MRSNEKIPPHGLEPKPARSRSNKLLPGIVFAGVILLIASQEIPGFRHAIDYYIAHESWQASETCNSKALQLGVTPDFMRIIEYGDVHKTENGFFIEKILVGEMAEQGGEQRFIVDCYTDPAGNLVRADRRN